VLWQEGVVWCGVLWCGVMCCGVVVVNWSDQMFSECVCKSMSKRRRALCVVCVWCVFSFSTHTHAYQRTQDVHTYLHTHKHGNHRLDLANLVYTLQILHHMFKNRN